MPTTWREYRDGTLTLPSAMVPVPSVREALVDPEALAYLRQHRDVAQDFRTFVGEFPATGERFGYNYPGPEHIALVSETIGVQGLAEEKGLLDDGARGFAQTRSRQEKRWLPEGWGRAWSDLLRPVGLCAAAVDGPTNEDPRS